MRITVSSLVLICVGSYALSPAHAQVQCEHPASSGDSPLFVAQVVDAETGEPIPHFVALAGVNPIEGLGWQWQPHTAQEFHDGQLRWPPAGKRGYAEQVVRVEAQGYVPYQSPRFKGPSLEESSEPTPHLIRLQRDPGVESRVVLPNGEPIVGAMVALGIAIDQVVVLANGKISHQRINRSRLWPREYRKAETDADGRFTLPTEIQPAVVVVAHDVGVAVLSYEEFQSTPDIQLKPWGLIEGRVLWGGQPASDVEVTLIAKARKGDEELQPAFSFRASQTSKTDELGRITFEKVPPGPAQISGPSDHPTQFVDVLAGRPTEFVLGGLGRPVIGQLTGRASWENVKVRIAPTAPRAGDLHIPDSPWKSYYGFRNSQAGPYYFKHNIAVAADGRFTIPDVPPEHYQLFVDAPREDGSKRFVGGTKFSIETLSGGKSDEPLDVGTIVVVE